MNVKLREPMSGFTHFIGIIFAIVALILLLTRPSPTAKLAHIISFSIFGGAMILLYTFSTLYHWLPISGKRLEAFRTIDHIMIFVFIAATYTPVCLITLRGAWGWSVLASVWGLTALGVVLKIFWLNAPRFLYTGVYLLMGWIIIIAIWPLIHLMNPRGLFWMALGGLFYTIGAVIYALKKPDPWPRVFGFHEIFHIFILLGSFSHFWMIYHYV
ncbi:MAG: hemolysin III family protein [Calditrichaeota bacterium]|nr:hemolysin III family protein [Calditrichota bacterium]